MGRRKKGNDVHGWLVLDKSLNLTSTDAVNKIKRAFNANKCGHAGTLDPLATGVLPIALGEATRTVAWLMEAQKTYIFTVEWGKSTDTQDKEGEVIATSDVRPSKEQIAEKLKTFLGDIDQVPPKYSAIKVDGERAYDLARDGEEFELNPRKVKTYELEIREVTENSATIFVKSGKGFYVRALARDLAKALGTEGHITYLRRTSVGPFKEETAITLEKVQELCIDAPALEILSPIETALDDIPELAIKEGDVFSLRQGRKIMVLPNDAEALKKLRKPREIAGQDMSRAVLATFEGNAIALGNLQGGHFAPVRVFQHLK